MGNEDQLSPGSGAIQMGGESWSKRLGEICRKIVYEKVGEEEIYDMWYKRHRSGGGESSSSQEPELGDRLCREELRECQWRPHAGPKPPPETKDKKSDSKSEKKKAKGEQSKS